MAANDTRRLRVVVTGESSEASQALEQVGESADQAENKLVTLTKSIGMFAIKGAVALGAVGAAAVTMGFSTASQLEQATVGFTTMLGSAQKAQKFLKELQDFANKTPFEFTELTGAAQKFLAMGFNAKEVIPMLTAVGDAVAAMGGSAENIDSVTTALGQMQAKGKVSGEELMQLTEQGIPALKILADSYGVSTAKMSDMITKGQVLSGKAIPALIKGLEHGTKNVKGFAGMMSKQSETMKGKWSTFMDTLQMGLGNIAMKFLPMAKTAIDTLSKGFGNFFAGIEGKGKVKGFTGQINELGLGLRALWSSFKEGDITSDGMVGKFELVGATIRGVINAFKEGKVVSGGWRGELEQLAAWAKDLSIMLEALAGGLGTTVHWFKENQTAAKILFTTLFLLTALVKAHAAATGVQAAGGLIAMFKSTALVNGVTKIATALQWAWSGALVAWMHISYYSQLAGIAVKQKLLAAGTKIATAAQWLWNVALNANPIGIVVIAIAAMVAAIFLLWKHNEGFRKWVLNVLWPSLKKAWEQLQHVFQVVVDTVVGAWNWLRSNAIAIWEDITSTVTGAANAVKDAVTGAFNATVNTVTRVFRAIADVVMSVINSVLNFFQPLFNVFNTLGRIVVGFYNAAWKVTWILIQIAVKLFVEFMQSQVVPKIRFALAVITAMVNQMKASWNAAWSFVMMVVGKVTNWFKGTIVTSLSKAFGQLKTVVNAFKLYFQAQWNQAQAAAQRVANWFSGTIVTSWRKAFDQLKFVLRVLAAYFSAQWNIVTTKARAAFQAFSGPIAAVFNSGLTKLRGWLNGFRGWWNGLFDGMKNKSNSAMTGIVSAFNKGRDGIKRAWDSVVATAKKPINFIVNDVYNNRIRALWNKVAGTFGISTRLDAIQGFARGGVVPGSGNKDTELALLTPGEGILTKKEMAALGGPGAFAQFRQAIAQYNKGGVVGGGRGPQGDGIGGWFSSLASKAKDFIQGMAAPVVRPLANAIKSFMGGRLGNSGMEGLLKGGGNKMVDGLMSWVIGKDKDLGSIGGAGGSGMGYRRQQALISQAFPGLQMISGFRRGATTLSGNRSYHSIGRAVDYPPNRALALWIRSHFGSATKELITPWNELNLHNGRPHRYTGAVWNQHNFPGGNAHDHWAMDTASTVQPGWFTGYNGTGKPETLVNADKMGGITWTGNIIINGAGDPKAIAKEVRAQLISLSRRNGGQSGLPKK